MGSVLIVLHSVGRWGRSSFFHTARRPIPRRGRWGRREELGVALNQRRAHGWIVAVLCERRCHWGRAEALFPSPTAVADRRYKPPWADPSGQPSFSHIYTARIPSIPSWSPLPPSLDPPGTPPFSAEKQTLSWIPRIRTRDRPPSHEKAAGPRRTCRLGKGNANQRLAVASFGARDLSAPADSAPAQAR